MTRVRYEGPIEPGMVFVAFDSKGAVYRRDMIVGRHPRKPGIILYEALPCPMRKYAEGVGEIGQCPELNLRIVMRPAEEPV
jgi:hypothetical protein